MHPSTKQFKTVTRYPDNIEKKLEMEFKSLVNPSTHAVVDAVFKSMKMNRTPEGKKAIEFYRLSLGKSLYYVKLYSTVQGMIEQITTSKNQNHYFMNTAMVNVLLYEKTGIHFYEYIVPLI